ncbi:unnamed protein product [Amoebophrya sp. A120]|nr:unnamed protein product [Amoebophrya sp. A120]|eukprot:GSA120T00011533001.1
MVKVQDYLCKFFYDLGAKAWAANETGEFVDGSHDSNFWTIKQDGALASLKGEGDPSKTCSYHEDPRVPWDDPQGAPHQRACNFVKDDIIRECNKRLGGLIHEWYFMRGARNDMHQGRLLNLLHPLRNLSGSAGAGSTELDSTARDAALPMEHQRGEEEKESGDVLLTFTPHNEPVKADAAGDSSTSVGAAAAGAEQADHLPLAAPNPANASAPQFTADVAVTVIRQRPGSIFGAKDAGNLTVNNAATVSFVAEDESQQLLLSTPASSNFTNTHIRPDLILAERPVEQEEGAGDANHIAVEIEKTRHKSTPQKQLPATAQNFTNSGSPLQVPVPGVLDKTANKLLEDFKASSSGSEAAVQKNEEAIAQDKLTDFNPNPQEEGNKYKEFSKTSNGNCLDYLTKRVFGAEAHRKTKAAILQAKKSFDFEIDVNYFFNYKIDADWTLNRSVPIRIPSSSPESAGKGAGASGQPVSTADGPSPAPVASPTPAEVPANGDGATTAPAAVPVPDASAGSAAVVHLTTEGPTQGKMRLKLYAKKSLIHDEYKAKSMKTRNLVDGTEPAETEKYTKEKIQELFSKYLVAPDSTFELHTPRPQETFSEDPRSFLSSA